MNRNEFEKIPEIKDSLNENIVFVGNKYTTTNDGFYDLVNWLNGAWYAWQEQQKKIDDQTKKIIDVSEILEAESSNSWGLWKEKADMMEQGASNAYEKSYWLIKGVIDKQSSKGGENE